MSLLRYTLYRCTLYSGDRWPGFRSGRFFAKRKEREKEQSILSKKEPLRPGFTELSSRVAAVTWHDPEKIMAIAVLLFAIVYRVVANILFHVDRRTHMIYPQRASHPQSFSIDSVLQCRCRPSRVGIRARERSPVLCTVPNSELLSVTARQVESGHTPRPEPGPAARGPSFRRHTSQQSLPRHARLTHSASCNPRDNVQDLITAVQPRA